MEHRSTLDLLNLNSFPQLPKMFKIVLYQFWKNTTQWLFPLKYFPTY